MSPRGARDEVEQPAEVCDVAFADRQRQFTAGGSANFERKNMRADAEVHKSEDPFRQVIDLIPALAWSCRPDGSADFFNRSWLDYTGLSEHDALDWGWTAAFHPDDVSTVVAYWQSLLVRPEPGEIEARLRRFDGEYRWFLFRAKPLLDESGRVIKWYGTNTDIEDRKCAEDALRASELNFRLIVDSIPALVCTMTPAGELEVINRQILDYFGKTRDELKDWSSIGAVHEDDVEDVIAKWRYSTETGQPYDVEHRIRRAEGVYRWFHVRGLPLRDMHNRIVRWYILLVDIDDRKHAEDGLRESERELRQLVETIPTLVWRGTPEGQLDYLNQRHIDYLGQTLEDTAGGRWVDLVHPDDKEATVRRWLHSVNTGTPYEDVYRLRRADGQYRWIQSAGQPFHDREGRITHWYGMVIDIDDRKSAEDALRESERELRQTRRRLSAATQIATVAELSASIAHEINQPLASVVANGHACVAWLSNDPPNLERARLTAGRIIRDGNAAAEVVTRIRALFKQAAPAVILSDINDIVVEALKLMADEIRDSGIIVETDLGASLPMIVVDRVQIQQTLINLAHNAIEAINGVTDRPKVLVLISRRDGVDILIQVRDSGCGIAHPTSIFDPFFTTKENGMGMGLAICLSIVEVHGGRLWATPNEGAGTTFSFTLPLHPDVSV